MSKNNSKYKMGKHRKVSTYEVVNNIPYIETPEGIYYIAKGDNIVTINGNRYPVDPKKFKKEFEKPEKSS